MTERPPTYHHDVPTPVPEHIDTEDQLVIGRERDFLELQEPQHVREIGAYALRRAQELIQLSYACEEVLVDWNEAEKSRARKVDVTGRLKVFEGSDE